MTCEHNIMVEHRVSTCFPLVLVCLDSGACLFGMGGSFAWSMELVCLVSGACLFGVMEHVFVKLFVGHFIPPERCCLN
jgi:hypothetical protein